MSWQPRWRHVSQLFRHDGDGPDVVEGANDCFEAALARYLREQGYPFAGGDAALVADLRRRVTGAPDRAGQGYTSLAQATQGLGALGIAARWTAGLDDALRADWAILWVRAARLRLAQPVTIDGAVRWTAYPLSWLGDGGEPDHFILKLPSGAFNDPLAYWVDDCAYSTTSLAGAFGGAWVLLSPPRLEAPRATFVVSAAEGLHLREAPALEARVLATLDAGERVADVYDADCLWRFVLARGQHGWVRREYVKSS